MLPGDVTTEALLRDLHTRFERVERAILGDPSVGHRGLVDRVELLEVHDREATHAHDDLDARRQSGDESVRAYISEIEGELMDRIDEVAAESAESAARVESKIDNLRWTVLGAAAAVVGAATWLIFAAGRFPW